MENTYWNGKGKYQALADKLQDLVPAEGPAECKHVDTFRGACNAYYDIFNNGGGNSVNRKVSTYFPGVMSNLRSRAQFLNPDWELIESMTEPMMDIIILKVAKAKNYI